jgi:hypothetical protein
MEPTEISKVNFTLDWWDEHWDDVAFIPEGLLEFAEAYVEWLKEMEKNKDE